MANEISPIIPAQKQVVSRKDMEQQRASIRRADLIPRTLGLLADAGYYACLAAASPLILVGSLTGCQEQEVPAIIEGDRDLEPCEFFGYMDPNQDNIFTPFLGEPDWGYLEDANLNEWSWGKTAYGSIGVNDLVLEPADVTGKTMAIMRYSPGNESRFTKNGDYRTYTYMFAIGNKAHEDNDPYDPSKPRILNINGRLTETPPFLIGDDANKFWPNGIAIQSPNYQGGRFAIVLNMTGDPVSGKPAPAEGTIGYPGTEEIIWYNIGYDENDVPFKGIPVAPWVQYDEDFNRYSYGTVAKISPEPGEPYRTYFERKVEFLKNSILPEVQPGYAPVIDEPSPSQAVTPGMVYFDTQRNDADLANANGYAFTGMGMPSAVYVSPKGPESLRVNVNMIRFQLQCVDISNGTNGEGAYLLATKIYLDEPAKE